MADLVYNVVKAPMGWVVHLDRVRLGGVYGTKEAAFEAAMVAASFAVRDGEGVHISVPSDAKLRDAEPTEPWPKEWNAFLKRQPPPGGFIMTKDAFDRWWEWVEKPPDSTLTIPAHFHDAVMQLPPEQRRDRRTVNEAIRLADPDAQR